MSESKENHTSSRDGDNDSVLKCSKCHGHTAQFQSDPCGHLKLCESCARKIATGGKCKTCGIFFLNLRRITEIWNIVDEIES